MRTSTRLSALAAAALMAVLTVATTAQPASAATATTNTWDTGGGIDLVLTPAETSDVFYDSIHAASTVCSQAISGAIADGVRVSSPTRPEPIARPAPSRVSRRRSKPGGPSAR